MADEKPEPGNHMEPPHADSIAVASIDRTFTGAVEPPKGPSEALPWFVVSVKAIPDSWTVIYAPNAAVAIEEFTARTGLQISAFDTPDVVRLTAKPVVNDFMRTRNGRRQGLHYARAELAAFLASGEMAGSPTDLDAAGI